MCRRAAVGIACEQGGSKGRPKGLLGQRQSGRNLDLGERGDRVKSESAGRAGCEKMKCSVSALCSEGRRSQAEKESNIAAPRLTVAK